MAHECEWQKDARTDILLANAALILRGQKLAVVSNVECSNYNQASPQLNPSLQFNCFLCTRLLWHNWNRTEQTICTWTYLAPARAQKHVRFNVLFAHLICQPQSHHAVFIVNSLFGLVAEYWVCIIDFLKLYNTYRTNHSDLFARGISAIVAISLIPFHDQLRVGLSIKGGPKTDYRYVF